jgi:PAS domain S-box-containing protein
MASSPIFKVEERSAAKRYFLAVLIATAALVLRLALLPLLGGHAPFLAAMAATIFAVWWCGTGPAIISALIGLLGVWYLVLPPSDSFSLNDPKGGISTMVGYLLLTGLVIALGETDRRAGAKLRALEQQQRRLAEEAAAATAKFRAVFEQTTVFAGIMNVDGTLIDANRLSLEACGYKAEEVLGKQFWGTPWWRNYPESQEKIRNATLKAAQGTPYRETLMYSFSDSPERVVDFALYPIRDQDGKVLFLHPTGIDITEQKRVEAELLQSREHLERTVEARTQELGASLAKLESEIVSRKATEKALRELSARTLRLQDEERRRLARDLHDSTGQTLAALKISLDSLQDLVAQISKAPSLLNDLEALADQALQEVRTTSHLLHPPMLDEVGFSSAAQWYVDGFSKRCGIKTSLELTTRPALTKDEELVFFRILQESLTNVLRHSASQSVDIRLAADENDAILSIRDYGKGIPPATLTSFRETAAGVGVGLGGMRQRVLELGGHLKVDSDEHGTCITAMLPLTKQGLLASERASITEPTIRAS